MENNGMFAHLSALISLLAKYHLTPAELAFAVSNPRHIQGFVDKVRHHYHESVKPAPTAQ